MLLISCKSIPVIVCMQALSTTVRHERKDGSCVKPSASRNAAAFPQPNLDPVHLPYMHDYCFTVNEFCMLEVLTGQFKFELCPYYLALCYFEYSD